MTKTPLALTAAFVLCTMQSHAAAGDVSPIRAPKIRSVLKRGSAAQRQRTPSAGELSAEDIQGIQLEAYPEIPTRPSANRLGHVPSARNEHAHRTSTAKPETPNKAAPIVLPEFGRSTLPWRTVRRPASTDVLSTSQSRPQHATAIPSPINWHVASSENHIVELTSPSKLVSFRKPATASRIQFNTVRPEDEITKTEPVYVASGIQAQPDQTQQSQLSKRLPLPMPLPQTTKTRGASKVVSITPSPRPSVRVDTKELRQRITSHNLLLRGLEDQLRNRQNWDFHSLYLATDEVEELLRSRGVWMLYWTSLDTRQRRRMNPIASFDNVVEMLRQRIFEAQVEAEINQAAFDANKKERLTESLEQLDQRVMSLAI